MKETISKRGALPEDPNQDPSRLDGSCPIVLFPVRIETRFDRSASQLKIRIFPDEVLANAHEPGLTSEEAVDAENYWTQASNAGGEPEAWRTLVAKYRAPRAAWLAKARQPGAPAYTTRPASWSTAVRADLLPDRWCAVVYREGVELDRAFSKIVAWPLALTIGPDVANDDTTDISGDGLKLDSDLAWTVNLDRAFEVGMAIKLTLEENDFSLGFDRLVVVGVRGSLDPSSAAKAIGGLLEAHHYFKGWAFVPQGTFARNAAGSTSGYPAPDENARESFRVERGAPLTADQQCDGLLWARAMGIDPAIVAHIAGADGQEQRRARAMNRALYSGTLGYYLGYFMNPVIPDQATADLVGAHFVDWVRGRGPLPAWRVGGVPYGILPVTSLNLWQPSDRASAIDRQLPALLRQLRTEWAKMMTLVPRIGLTSEVDWDLIEIFCTEASARQFRVRPYLGAEMQWGLVQLLGGDWQDWLTRQQAAVKLALSAIGHADWNPFICSGLFTEDTAVFGGPLVADTTSETDPLASNYIDWITAASVDDLDNNNVSYGALFYLLLRYSALIEYSNAAMNLLIPAGLATEADRHEQAMIKIVPGTEQHLTLREQLKRPIAGITAGRSVGQFLSPGGGANLAPISSFRQALQTLRDVPTAELERLFTETLDLSTDRLDAWCTSLSTKRLEEMRAAAPTGSHIGAVAWVENLHPANPSAAKYGYVHAPSSAHAATAAVLRNAFLSYQGTPNAAPYSINLSSARVRAARLVLDAVRQGQQIGAVFGYQVESGLHDRQADVLIDPLRALFPLVANKTVDSGQPAGVIAARNVMDGLALRTAVRAAGSFPYNSLSISVTDSLRASLDAELAALDDTVDAVADLLLAESVHQIVRGNQSAASASLDNLAIGARPPDPDVAAMPRAGTLVTHRVGIILGAGAVAALAGWPGNLTPRATAEPRIDAWIGNILGDPRTVRCKVFYLDQLGQAGHKEVTLDALGLRPLDVLSLSAAVATTQMASELDRRVVDAALGMAPGATAIKVIYDADPAWDRRAVRTFPEMFTLAQAAQAVVSSASVLAAQHLVPSYQADDAQAAGGWLADEAMTRATAAQTALEQLGSALHDAVEAVSGVTVPTVAQLATLRARLTQASLYGILSTFPAMDGTNEGTLAVSLFTQGKAADDEIARRLAAVNGHLPRPGAADADKIQAAQTIGQDIFGSDFVLLPGFRPTAAQDLARALANNTLVLDASEPPRWLERVARVRAALGRWRSLWLLAEAARPLNNAPAAPTGYDVKVLQLPQVDGDQWMALPLRSETDRVSGRVSLVLHRAATPAATDAWYGLLLDDWTESIPNATEQTALAFGYDDPGAEAPQAVLLAVPPVIKDHWDMETLLSIVNESIDMIKIRGVGLSLLTDIAQLLPGVFLFASPANESYSTSLLDQLYNPPTVK